MMMLLKLTFRNLHRNTRRSFLILFTVASGICALMIYHGFNQGIMNQYRENTIHSRYGHGQLTQTGYYDSVYEKPWEHWIEDSSRVKKSLSTLPEVKYVFPRVQFYALLTAGNISISGKGQGIDAAAEAEFFNTLNIEEGVQLKDQADGTILGKGLARALKVKVGDRITVVTNTIHGSMNAVDLYVSGIFHTGVKDFDDGVFRMPLALAHTLLDTTKVESVSLGLDGVGSWTKVARHVAKNHAELEAISFDVLDKVYYQNSVDFLNSQFSFIFTIIFLIVSLGIFNSISSSIIERKHEIGNLLANGQSKLSVVKLLLSESILIGLFGSLIGVALAYLINLTILKNGVPMPPGPGITRQFITHVELQTSFIGVSIFTALISSLLGTMLSTWKIMKTSIAELLRSY